jgi:hypothetical protein
MSYTKNTALVNFNVFMNSLGKVPAWTKSKMWCQMTTSANANKNNREIPDAALRRKIAERAYHIWLEKGGGHGDHEHHWFEAERELMETEKQQREQRSDVRNGQKPVSRINRSDRGLSA